MQLTVKGKQLDVGEALRAHVTANLSTVTAKYFPRPIEATVVFSREKHRFRADVSVHAGRNVLLQSIGEADDPYRAFDGASAHMAKRLRRYKRRLVDDHHKPGAAAAPPEPARAYVLAVPEGEDEAPAEPVVIAEIATEIDSLTVGEAVMRLDLGELPALMFRNRAHGGLNLVYRRGDGNVGWVDPQGRGETIGLS